MAGKTMKAVLAPKPGGPEALTILERPIPQPGPSQLLVRVRAIGINRADAMQRAGSYSQPPGQSDILGLELAGEVAACGSGVSGFATGARVFALVAAGAYAEYALVDAGLAVPVPPAWDYPTAAAVIETFCTANETIFELGALQAGERVLIHAGASGVGTAGLQMAKHRGAVAYVTVGSAAKAERIRALGADAAINYRETDFAAEVLRLTEGRGVDLVLDFIGASYMPRNLASLAQKGRLILAGVLGPAPFAIDPSPILYKRLRVMGFTLRPQTIAEKTGIVARFAEAWLPPLAAGAIRPMIHKVLPFADVREAHRIVEANENFGKVVLTLA